MAATGIDNISTLGQDTWIEIKQQAMSTEELRSVPSSVLTANLAGQNFSVICIMKVYDTTTEGYRSVVQIDYAQKRFGAGTLSMTIGYTDGTKETITGLTSAQIEEFMEWLYRRQNGLGPVFYTVKVGNKNYFINYYAIATVNVVEG